MSEQPDAEHEGSDERARGDEVTAPPPPGGPQRTDAPSGPLTAGGPAHEEDTTTDTEGQ